MQPQDPTTQQTNQTQNQTATPAAPVFQAPVKKKTSKTSGGVFLVIYASLTLLLGLSSLVYSLLLSLVMIALGVYWLIAGIKVLKSEATIASRTLSTATTLVISYACILLVAGLILPGFRLSGAVMPIIFAVILMIISSRLKKQVA